MKKALWLIVIIVLIFSSTAISHAALVDNGDGTITDTDAGLMWLKDANYAETIGLDDALYGQNFNGRLEYMDAYQWVNDLVFAGYDDWRLPEALQPDPNCSNQDAGDGSWGYNCTGSDMGHLYYIEGISLSDSQPFNNLQRWYVTGTPWWGGDKYMFDFSDGYSFLEIGAASTGTHFSILPVRDISVVPEPMSSILFVTGGTLLAGRRYIKRKKTA